MSPKKPNASGKKGGRPRKNKVEKISEEAENKENDKSAEGEKKPRRREAKEQRKRRKIKRVDQEFDEMSTLSHKFQVREKLDIENGPSSPKSDVALGDKNFNIQVSKSIGQRRKVLKKEDSAKEEQPEEEQKEAEQTSARPENEENEEEEESEGSFKKLTDALEEIGKKYDIEYQELTRIFETTCCDFNALELFLEHKDRTQIWNPLEDMALKLDHDSIEYQYLLNTKGQERIDQRVKFLNDREDEEPESSMDIEIVQEAEQEEGAEPEESKVQVENAPQEDIKIDGGDS